MKTEKPLEIALEGVIVPVAWGPAGEVLEVGLATVGEAEYRIDPTIAWAHFLKGYLRKRVRMSAILCDDRVLRVKRVDLVPITDP